VLGFSVEIGNEGRREQGEENVRSRKCGGLRRGTGDITHVFFSTNLPPVVVEQSEGEVNETNNDK
jgi:hypothetical protein